MPHELRMPSLGQNTDELRIVEWLKSEGERVTFGEPLLEVETDKAVLEVEATVAGTLLRIVHTADETVVAGSLIAYIGAPGEALPPGTNHSRQDVAHADDAAPAGVEPPAPAAPPPAPHGTKVLATPTARQMAKELGVDLRAVAGSGPQGRIEKHDVAAHQAQAQPGSGAAPQTPVPPQPAPRRLEPATDQEGDEQPVPRHRVVVAQRLLRSVQSMPQISIAMSADMSRARAAIEYQRSRAGVQLSYTHVLLRAIAHALRLHPPINRVWLPDGPRYRRYTRADVGLAIAGDNTLLVATVPEPDRPSLAELAEHVAAAVARGRKGALTQADLAPTAITLSNLGMHGVDEFTAIVDPDQSAILAAGRVIDQAVVINGGMYILPQLKLRLTVDHRIADGVAAAAFLADVRAALERGDS